MDQATTIAAAPSCRKLLQWPLLGGSGKKEKRATKVSSLKRRLQAHAAIARSLSPFCARTSFDSASLPDENSKCLISLSAFMHACSRCASSSLKDVHVPSAPPLLSSPENRAYLKAIHQHLLYAHRHSSAPSPASLLNQKQHRTLATGSSHTEGGHSSMKHIDDHGKKTLPSQRGGMQIMEAHEIVENEGKDDKQVNHRYKMHARREQSAMGELSAEKKKKPPPHKLKNSLMEPGVSNPLDQTHLFSLSSKMHRVYQLQDGNNQEKKHERDRVFKRTHSLAKESVRKSSQTGVEPKHKKHLYVEDKAMQTPRLEADLYICSTAHVLEQHESKMRAFEEDMTHYYKNHKAGGNIMNPQQNQDPPLLKSTCRKHACRPPILTTGSKAIDLPAKEGSKEAKLMVSDVASTQDTHYCAATVSSLKESKISRHPHKSSSLKFKSLPAFQAHHDLLSLKTNESSQASKDLSSVKASESHHTNKELSFKVTPLPAYSEPLKPCVEAPSGVQDSVQLRHDNERATLINPETCDLSGGIWKASESSQACTEFSFKVTPLDAYSEPYRPVVESEGSIRGLAKATQSHEKIKFIQPDACSLSGGIWLPDTLPVVKYSHNPYLDFHNSMLEMLLGRGLRDLHELQDMFVCYVLLNTPDTHKHIEKAFKDLLIDLYRCKFLKSLQS